MRLLKPIAVAFLILIGLSIGVSFILPKQIFLSRNRLIHAESEAVFDYLADIKKWDQWSPWHLKDPSMQKTYFGNQGEKGYGYEWKSKKLDLKRGRISMEGYFPHDSIWLDMDIEGKGKAKGFFFLKKMKTGTELTWAIQTNLGNNPIKRWVGLWLDKSIGNQFEIGLKNLDSVITGNNQLKKAKYKLDLSSDTIPAFNYISIIESCSEVEVPSKVTTLFKELQAFAKQNKVRVNGKPFVIYQSISPENMKLEVGLPLNVKRKVKGRILQNRLPGFIALVGHYRGPLNNLDMARNQMQNHITDNNLKRINNNIDWFPSQFEPFSDTISIDMMYPLATLK